MSQGASVDEEASLQTKIKFAVRTDDTTERTRSAYLFLGSCFPVMATVDVPTGHVNPRLTGGGRNSHI